MHILCLNSGSSSLKFAVYRCDNGDDIEVARGAVEGIAQEHGRLWIQQATDSRRQEIQRSCRSHQAAFEAAMDSLSTLPVAGIPVGRGSPPLWLSRLVVRIDPHRSPRSEARTHDYRPPRQRLQHDS